MEKHSLQGGPLKSMPIFVPNTFQDIFVDTGGQHNDSLYTQPVGWPFYINSNNIVRIGLPRNQ